MEVETYEVLEMTEDYEEQANDPEVQKIIDELGLGGQKERLSASGVQNPYRRMSAEEQATFETLFINHEDVTAYSDGPIPLRVLQVASHAASLDRYGKIEVWHNAALKDPVLVGVIGFNSYDILARWGEALEDFGVLATMAREKMADDMRAKLNATISKCEGMLNSVDSLVHENFCGRTVFIPS